MFTGREYDSETGLYYYRARYYSPQLGRFLQRDPVGYWAGINLYTYCSNNPTSWIDPFGWDKNKEKIPWWEKWIKKYGSIDVTFNAGTGFVGVSGQLSITGSGITGYVGVGWGIGFGVSVTGGGNIGSSSG
jgi:RHS repeat-associated protein